MERRRTSSSPPPLSLLLPYLLLSLLFHLTHAGSCNDFTWLPTNTCQNCIASADLNDGDFAWNAGPDWATGDVPSNDRLCFQCFSSSSPPNTMDLDLVPLSSSERAVSGLFFERGCSESVEFDIEGGFMDEDFVLSDDGFAGRASEIQDYVHVHVQNRAIFQLDADLIVSGDLEVESETNGYNTLVVNNGVSLILNGRLFLESQIELNSGTVQINTGGEFHIGQGGEARIACSGTSTVDVAGLIHLHPGSLSVSCTGSVVGRVQAGGVVIMQNDGGHWSSLDLLDSTAQVIVRSVDLYDDLGTITGSGELNVESGASVNRADGSMQLRTLTLGQDALVRYGSIDVSGGTVVFGQNSELDSTGSLLDVDEAVLVSKSSGAVVSSPMTGTWELVIDEDAASFLELSATGSLGSLRAVTAYPSSSSDVIQVLRIASEGDWDGLVPDPTAVLVITPGRSDTTCGWRVRSSFTNLFIECDESSASTGAEEDAGNEEEDSVSDNDSSTSGNPQLVATLAVSGAVVGILGAGVFALARRPSSSSTNGGDKDKKSAKGGKKGIKAAPNTVEAAVEVLLAEYSVSDLLKYATNLLDNGRNEAALVLAFRIESKAIGGPTHVYLDVLNVLGRALTANAAREAAKDVRRVYRATVGLGAKSKVKKSGLSGTAMEGVRKRVDKVSKRPLGARKAAGAGPAKKKAVTTPAKRGNPGNSKTRPNKSRAAAATTTAAAAVPLVSADAGGGNSPPDEGDVWETEMSDVIQKVKKQPIRNFMAEGGDDEGDHISVTSSMAPDF